VAESSGLSSAAELLEKTSAPSRVRPWWSAVRSVFHSPVAVFLVGFVVRLKVLTELLPARMWAGFYQYNEPSHIASELAAGLGFSSPWPNTPIAPTAQQPPLYPLVVAAIFKLAGIYSYSSLWLILGLNALLSAITGVLILRIGCRDFGVPTAVLAAWIWACWVYEATVSIRLWESTLATFLLMLGILLFAQMENSQNFRPWVLFGLLTGAAALTNTTLLSVLPLFWLSLWLIYRKRRESCTRVLLLSMATCVLVILPWTIRNYSVFHRLIPVRDNFGLELWVGVELDSNLKPPGNRPFPLDFPLCNPTEYNRLGELAFMDSRTRLSTQFIRDYPLDYLHTVLDRFRRFWSEPSDMQWPIISTLAWIGAILALVRKRARALPYLIVLVVFPLVYYATHTFPTYRQPIEPVMLLLASYALCSACLVSAKAFRQYFSHQNG
jgi:4-amino-4-deoxy-L-arabinose transferase-like glycosyltransferase